MLRRLAGFLLGSVCVGLIASMVLAATDHSSAFAATAESVASVYTATFSDSSQGAGFRLGRNDGSRFVDFRLRNFPNRNASVEGNRHRYVLTSQVTLDLFGYADRVKEQITFQSRPPVSSVSFDASWSQGLTVVQRDGDWHLVDGEGETQFVVRRPWMRDADGVAGEVTLSISGSTATLTADPGFLDTARYPVIIDPITDAVDSSVSTGDAYQVPIGSPLSTSGDYGLGISGCKSTPAAVCSTAYTYVAGTWSASLSSQPEGSTAAGKPSQVVMVSPTKAYAAGVAGTTAVLMWTITRASTTASWNWGSPITVAPSPASDRVSIITEGGSNPRVWVGYVRSGVGKVVSYTDNDGSSFVNATVSTQISHEVTLARRPSWGSGIMVYYRDDSGSNVTLSSRAAAAGQTEMTLYSVATVDTRTGLGRPAATMTPGDPEVYYSDTDDVVFSYPNGTRWDLRRCTRSLDAFPAWSCAEIATDVETPTDRPRYAVSADRDRLVVVYVPATGTNAHKLMYRVFYDGVWAAPRRVDTGVGVNDLTDSVAIAGSATGNKLLTMWRNVGSKLEMHVDDLDLPPILAGLSVSRSPMSRTGPCASTTYNSAAFTPDQVTRTVEIRDGATLTRTLTGSSSDQGVALSWDGLTTSGADSGVAGAEKTYSSRVSATDTAGWTVTRNGPAVVVDRKAPALTTGTSMAASNPAFSPNGDGAKDSTVLTAAFSEVATPTISIKNQAGTTIRTLTGSAGTSVSTTWDGKNSSGQVVNDGTYTATLSFTDAACNLSAAIPAVDLVVDRTNPVISALAAFPMLFSPNADGRLDNTTITATATDAASISWKIDVKNSSGVTKRTLAGSGGSVSAAWDGRDTAGSTVPDSAYSVAVAATDAAGNVGSSTVGGVTVDTTPPTVTGFEPSNPAFSPNGDGVKDTSVLAAAISDVSGPIDFGLAIRNGNIDIVSFGGQASPGQPLATWAGKDSVQQDVGEGSYVAGLTATDAVGNRSAVLSTQVVVDRTPPFLVLLNPVDGSSTIYPQQSISVRSSDSLAGLAADAGEVRVARTPTPNDVIVRSMSSPVGSTILSSGLISLVADSDYAGAASVIDRAGNTSRVKIAFRAVAAAFTNSTATIPASDCVLDPPTAGLQRKAICSAQLSVAASAVSVSSLSHGSDTGLVANKPSLSTANVDLMVDGVVVTSHPASNYATAAWQEPSISRSFRLPPGAPGTAVTLTLPGRERALPPLQVTGVPAFINRVRLSMPAGTVTTTPVSCQQPTDLQSLCASDPFLQRYMIRAVSQAALNDLIADRSNCCAVAPIIVDRSNQAFELVSAPDSLLALLSRSDVESITRIGSVGSDVADGIRRRTDRGWPADGDDVARLFNSEFVEVHERSFGGVYNSEELEEMKALSTLDADIQDSVWPYLDAHNYRDPNGLPQGTFGGMFINTVTGHLVVQFAQTDRSQQEAALRNLLTEPSRLETRTVGFSLSALDALHDQIVSDRAVLISVGVDARVVASNVEGNSVLVHVAGDLETARQQFSLRYPGRPPIEVIQSEGSVLAQEQFECPRTLCARTTSVAPPLVAGQHIRSHLPDSNAVSNCTSSFISKRSTVGGGVPPFEYFVMTAGHCGDIPSAWEQAADDDELPYPIGPMTEDTVHSYNTSEPHQRTDSALLATGGPPNVTPKISRNKGDLSGIWVRKVQGRFNDVVGQNVCMSGYKTERTICGKILSTNDSAYSEEVQIYFDHLRRAAFAGIRGDSGGPVFSIGETRRGFWTEEWARAEGVVHALVRPQTWETYYSGIGESMVALSVEVMVADG